LNDETCLNLLLNNYKLYINVEVLLIDWDRTRKFGTEPNVRPLRAVYQLGNSGIPLGEFKISLLLTLLGSNAIALVYTTHAALILWVNMSAYNFFNRPN